MEIKCPTCGCKWFFILHDSTRLQGLIPLDKNYFAIFKCGNDECNTLMRYDKGLNAVSKIEKNFLKQ